MSSIFQGTARKSGDSIVVTIPKQIADGLNIIPGTQIKISVQKMGDQKEENK